MGQHFLKPRRHKRDMVKRARAVQFRGILVAQVILQALRVIFVHADHMHHGVGHMRVVPVVEPQARKRKRRTRADCQAQHGLIKNAGSVNVCGADGEMVQ